MQTTLTATLYQNQPYLSGIKFQLDTVTALHSQVQRKLYKDIVSYYNKNNVNTLSKQEINRLKSTYQDIYDINARQYNSIYTELLGKISSVLALNKDYLIDTKENIKSLEKKLKSKQKILDNLLNEINKKDYAEKHIDNVNLTSLKHKVYRIKNNLNKANNKLKRLEYIETTGDPKLCFGGNKLFNQQFQINKNNNLTKFKSHSDWKKELVESRNKSFCLIGSLDENSGNQNCQIRHIGSNIYELKVNVKPKELKLKDRYISFQIKLHNDKNNLILNAINNNLDEDVSKHQALSYRFYKDYKNNTYKVFISLDKSKQKPKLVSHKLLGCIGIDINHDHLSITEINHHGNLKKFWDLPLNLKGKSSDQALDNIACAVKSITNYAVKVGKPIVIEKLDFSSKKKELANNKTKNKYNKKYNVMLSSFAYRKILELVKSRSFDKGIEIIEVNPAYTSKIGKYKYQNLYKLTSHQAASFVIARRGFFSYTKVKFKKSVRIDKQTHQEVIKKEYKEVVVLYKEKRISSRRNKHYPFALPVRNSQKQEGVYWKEVEQGYQQVKKQRIDLKRKKRILSKQKASVVDSCLQKEITLVTNNLEVHRDLNPNLLLSPF